MTRAPDALPILERGRHKRPRDGACLMEFASVLAGEKFTDHPTCTDPVLAALAREVNDHTSDAARSRLGVLAADLVGARGADVRHQFGIVRRALLTALAVTEPGRRDVLFVGLAATERAMSPRPQDWCTGMLTPDAELAFTAHRGETAAVEDFLVGHPARAREFRRRGVYANIERAVGAIAAEGPQRADRVLYDLLARSVRDYRRSVPVPAPAHLAVRR